MQMDMENILPGRFPMCQKKIDALILYLCLWKAQRDPLRDLKQMGAGFRRQIRKVLGVGFWNDKDMSGVDRLNVHERQAEVIFVDDAGGGFAFYNLTKDTGCH
jgi:hypothetical protein